MATRFEVADPHDPLLADFVALNDPEERRRVERAGGYFVVEGMLAIERLLGLGGWEVRALALLPRVADRLAPLLQRTEAPVAVCGEEVLREVVGFDLHRGALASVQRRAPARLADVLATPGASGLLLALEGVNDHENLGALYRNAAAFGADAVVVDPRCADPFYRRSVRVSLGHVLAVPTVAVDAAPAGIGALHAAGVVTVALTPRADRPLRDLVPADLGDGPVAALVGAEGPGLSDAALGAATHRVAIEMASGVDSINVATAAALALDQLRHLLAQRGRDVGGQ